MLARLIRGFIIVILLVGANFSFAARAPQSCTLVSGTLIQMPNKPVFKFNTARKVNAQNYPMTHTQFFIKDGNGETYKIVLDNLFYNNLTLAQASSAKDNGIINDLKSRYSPGSSVVACGKIFKSSGKLGLHFVHPRACEQTKFDGFLRINGNEIANNLNFCGACSCKFTSTNND